MITIDKKAKGSFITGFSSTFEAFPFIARNGMVRFLVIPLILNIALLSTIIWFTFIKVYPLIQGLVTFEQPYLQWVHYIIAPVLVIILLIASFFTYSITGTLIASPFLDIISLKTEKALGGDVPDPGFSLKAIWRMLMGMIRLMILMLVIYIVILPVNFVPFGAFIYSAVSFAVTAFFCGFQFYDMPLERREFTFNEKIRICRNFGSTVTGTGAAFILISLVPVIGFLGIVVSTCGATIAFREKMEKAVVRNK